MAGSVQPRIWTPPLVTGPPGPCGCGCALTEHTTTGFDEIYFAREVVGIPLDPWEEWLSIHAGETLPDGRPRFRTVLVLVARQNGKSTWARIKILYWMYVELAGPLDGESPFIIATSTDRSYAKKFWAKTGEIIKNNPLLAAELAEIRLSISEECITTTAGVEYGFAANNASAGRSRTVRRALVDEVREHKNLDAWGAISGAMNAVPDGQAVCISNQGDDSAVLLDSLHLPALTFIETGQGDPRLGLFEWSSPPGADPTDLHALAQANPNLGRRVDPDALLGAARRAVAAGGEELTSFRTEVMCQRVRLLNPAIDPSEWRACSDPGDLAAVRSRVAVVLDVAPDERHATLTAAAVLPDGRTRVEPVQAWSGPGCTEAMWTDLPAILARVRPAAQGWFSRGPAAAIGAKVRRAKGWTEITAEAPEVCMGFVELVHTRRLAHSGDPLQDAQVAGTERLYMVGERYVFSRKGGHCDSVWSMAGAAHLARTLPAPIGKPRLIVAE